MAREFHRDWDDCISQINFPSQIDKDKVVMKVNGFKITLDEYEFLESGFVEYTFDIYFYHEHRLKEDDVLSAHGNGKTLWSWSAKKGDMILEGKVISKGVSSKKFDADLCRSCGVYGEVRRTACMS